MTIGVFSITSQLASIEQRDQEAPLDRPAARDQPQRGIEQQAVDDVAEAVPVGEHLAGRGLSRSPTHRSTVPQVQIGLRPIASRIAAAAATMSRAAIAARRLVIGIEA